MAGCSCDNKKNKKVVKVEYLYLDLKTCERCIGTDTVLENVLSELKSAFALAGYSVKYQKVEIKTAEMAQAYRFLSSPTIRVNGRDICDFVQENNCGCCGDIAGTQVNCRVFSYNGKKYEVPPKEMLAERIMKLAFLSHRSAFHIRKYVLPKNLKKFFDGKQQKCCQNTDSCGCC